MRRIDFGLFTRRSAVGQLAVVQEFARAIRSAGSSARLKGRTVPA
jgi:hypothetical protein